MTTDYTSPAAFASFILDLMEQRARTNGTRFYTWKEPTDALVDFARDCHVAIDGADPRLPSDWVYSLIHEALCIVAHSADDFDDARDRNAETQRVVYNADAMEWLADHRGNQALFDEVVEEHGLEITTTYGITEAVDQCWRVAVDRIIGEIEGRHDRGMGDGLTVGDACQMEADSIAEAIGSGLEVNADFIARYCSDDVREILDRLEDEADQAEALEASLGDARPWGIWTSAASVVIPVGEVEVQLDRPAAVALADLRDWTISDGFAYTGMESVRIEVDLERLREEVVERLPSVTDRDRETFLAAYWEAVDFTASDADGGRIEVNARRDLDPVNVAVMEEQALDFLEAQWLWLHDADLDRAGGDFHYTRNGHGTGFWDGQWADLGERLTEAAKVYGACEVADYGHGLEVIG